MLQLPTTLAGSWIHLEPMNETHRDDLCAIAKDSRIWTYIATRAEGDSFDQWFAKAMSKLQSGHHLPFVVRRLSDQKIIGTTRYYDISPTHHRLMVGYTWYSPEVWGTYVNPECKYLLLQHAFEILKINRVEFATDSRNLRSRSAIKKLGANEEGLLRQHMVLKDGFVRDTVVFSIIKNEWPRVKSMLEERLKSFACSI